MSDLHITESDKKTKCYMKKRFILPKSFYNDIVYGEEGQAGASMSVPAVIFTSIGGGYLIYFSYNHGFLILGILAVILITVLITIFLRWYFTQVDLLANLRDDAVDAYKKAKQMNDYKNIELYTKELERLCVKLEDIDKKSRRN